MWDIIWYLGFPMFAISVFGSPYKRYDDETDKVYDRSSYDVVYDQKQNGTENYVINVDGLSMVWSANSLLAAAALLEPALYGEYPDTNIDIVLGPDNNKPETSTSKPLQGEVSKPDSIEPTQNKPNETLSSPTVLLINTNLGEKEVIKGNSSTSTKRKFDLPSLIKPFLRKRNVVPKRLSNE